MNFKRNKNNHYPVCLAIMVLISFGILLFLGACSLDRTNPLDPKNDASIRVPNKVIHIKLTVLSESQYSPSIKIEWPKDNSVDGYYIYRAMSKYSNFVRIATIDNFEINEYLDSDNIMKGYEYWYRMSAFIDYGEKGILEGKISQISENNAIYINE